MTQEPNTTTCPDCSAVVADLAAHEEWHMKLVRHINRLAPQSTRTGEESMRRRVF